MSILAATAALLVLGPAPAITSIRIERTPCFGRCPVYSATLFADGSVKYHGGANVPHLGDHKIQDPWKNMERLGRMAEKLGFFKLKDRYVDLHITDQPSLDITITRGKQVKNVHCYAQEPDEIWLLATAIDKVVDDAFKWDEQMKVKEQMSKVGKGSLHTHRMEGSLVL